MNYEERVFRLRNALKAFEDADTPLKMAGACAVARTTLELDDELAKAQHSAPARNRNANTIYVRGYDAEGLQVYTCARSTFNVHDDTRIMDAAVELVHARRRGVTIEPECVVRLLEGAGDVREHTEPPLEPEDFAIGSPAHVAAIDSAILLGLLGVETTKEAVDAIKALLKVQAAVNSPEIADFAAGVLLESAHQRMRWGTETEAGKAPADWFWLVGYLAGKALHAATAGNRDKALHHCVSTAAALCNWHAALSGADTSMRPGIDPVAAGVERAGAPA